MTFLCCSYSRHLCASYSGARSDCARQLPCDSATNSFTPCTITTPLLPYLYCLQLFLTAAITNCIKVSPRSHAACPPSFAYATLNTVSLGRGSEGPSALGSLLHDAMRVLTTGQGSFMGGTAQTSGRKLMLQPMRRWPLAGPGPTLWSAAGPMASWSLRGTTSSGWVGGDLCA